MLLCFNYFLKCPYFISLHSLRCHFPHFVPFSRSFPCFFPSFILCRALLSCLKYFPLNTCHSSSFFSSLISYLSSYFLFLLTSYFFPLPAIIVFRLTFSFLHCFPLFVIAVVTGHYRL